MYSTVKEALKNSGTFSLGQAGKAERELMQNEEIHFAASVNFSMTRTTENLKIDPFKLKDKVNGVIVVTNKRIYFVGGFGNRKTSVQMPIKNFQSMDRKSSLRMGKLRIQGMTSMFIVDGTTGVLKALEQAVNNAVYGDDVGGGNVF